MAKPTFKSLYNKFRDSAIINRGEQYAYWTLPYLMTDLRESASNGRVIVERDFQEVGALFVNNLSAKLARTLFPSQFPFFKIKATPQIMNYARKKGYDNRKLNAIFANVEKDVKDRIYLNESYASLTLAIRHLIITGNVLIYRDSKKRTITSWGMQSFACHRDGTGLLLDTILREFTTVEALPETLQFALRAKSSSRYARPEQRVEKYTRIHREVRNGVEGCYVSQQVDDIDVGEPTWWPKSLCPWVCPTWNLIPGEHYGRGLVEDYAGGFAMLSSLSESAALYSIEMMRVVHLVGAGSGGDVDELAEAESGEYVRGDPANIAAHETGDGSKLMQVEQKIERTIARLAKAFMYQGPVRDAERVTMYELQREAQEAEYALGGAYSTLSANLQVPLAFVCIAETSDELLAGVALGELMPDVIAGIPALGRSTDVQNLLMAGQEIAAIAPIVQLDKRLDPARIVDMILAGRSIDPEQIMFSPDEQRKNADAEAAAQQAQASLIKADTLANAGDALTQVQGA